MAIVTPHGNTPQPHGHADTYSSAGSLLATPIVVVVAATKQDDLLVVRGCLPLMQIAQVTNKRKKIWKI